MPSSHTANAVDRSLSTPSPTADPVQTARDASLMYVEGRTRGITRIRSGKGFRYLDASGKRIRDAATVARIRALAIPPAWTEVWICARANGHLQATGRDARKRKQYKYHERFRALRDETKFGRMIDFAEALPVLRKRVGIDLRLPGLPRAKVLAIVVRLLETTLIRVGNREYTRQNSSFGLTTMRDKHVAIKGSTLRFEFLGKSGKYQSVKINDIRLARLVRKCQEIPGQELFQYYNDAGERQTVTSSDINDYLRETTGQQFTAKDFRTWSGTVLAAIELRSTDRALSRKKALGDAITKVAARLGNTPTICRRCYVHPEVIDAYLEGVTIRPMRRRGPTPTTVSPSQLSPEETAVVALLRDRQG